VTDAPTSLGPEARVAELSPRELQVAILSAEGATVAELARDLGIGAGTVMSIRRHIRNKLGLMRDESLDSSLLGLMSAIGSADPPDSDENSVVAVPSATLARRRYLVLRQAISELERTGERITERVQTMRRLGEHEPDSGHTWQLEQLAALAEGLARFTEDFIASVRDHSPELIPSRRS
jgi:DNA-binding CsgD family transcriptional regulator